PSQIPEPYHNEVPHEIEESLILEIIESFGSAARRAKEAGLDGVEISASHNHLIDQFWSPRLNHRTDRWGGVFENRIRFALSVIESVRRHVGSDYVVGIRISADEFLEEFVRADTDPDHIVASHMPSHRLDDAQRKPDSILKDAAPSIRSVVKPRRPKLVDKVIVRGGDFHTIEPRLLSPAGCAAERLNDLEDERFFDLVRHLIMVRFRNLRR